MNKTLLTLFISLIITLRSQAQLPDYTVTVYDTTVTGYYFLCPIILPFNSAHMILDAKGRVVYYKYFNGQVVDYKMHPNGLMSYCYGNKYYIVDSTFMITDTIIAGNGFTTNLHELLILPDGHYLLLANENVPMNLSPYNYFLNNNSPGSPTASVRSNIIQELDENENVVFQWRLKDYVSFDSVDPFWCYNPSIVDWSHSNAVAKDDDGNYLISSRHFNEITKVNGNTGAVIWRFGGNYNQFTFINDTVPFYGQHDVRVLSNGNISLFDNGDHTIPHGARALEYRLDETNLTAEVVWSYVYDSAMYSTAMGNLQYLPNSNRLTCYGAAGPNGNICFDVVRPDNSKVFELAFHDSLNTYRAFFYEQLPWSFNRPHVTCYDSAGSYYLDAGAGHSAYSWSNGSSARVIEITSTDTFTVFVPYGQGGVISSEDFIVTDISNPCGLVSVNEISDENSVSLSPIPANDYLTVSFPNNHLTNDEIIIQDISGRVVFQTHLKGSQKLNLNISHLANGMYFLSAEGKSLKFIKGN